jgi:phosphoglycolate phosphatase
VPGRAEGGPPLHGIRLVVFDLDGTLVDSSRDLATAVNVTLARLVPGTPELPHDQVRSFIGDGARILLSRSLAAAGLGRTPEDALPVFLEAYAGCLLDTTRLYPGIDGALAALTGRTLAVLTNKPGALSRRLLEGLGVLSRFAQVLGGDEIVRKPDPSGLLRLLRENAVPAEAAVMVGDSANDVGTARAAGVACVGVSWGFDTARLLAAGPDLLIHGPEELPRVLPEAGRSC